jgi:FKBP-type peptidyl-prolyl cis-trans isomerase SlpA
MGRLADRPRIATGSHVTLHYRIAVVLDGEEREVMSTFDAKPATLTVGGGEFAEPLEVRLIGLAEGACERFDLPAGEGFGSRSAELVQSLAPSTFDAHTSGDVEYRPGDAVELASSSGLRVTGVLKERTAERVVVDFNHPLAGLPVRFDVKIVGVL